jgi:hypothetical protein
MISAFCPNVAIPLPFYENACDDIVNSQSGTNLESVFGQGRESHTFVCDHM